MILHLPDLAIVMLIVTMGTTLGAGFLDPLAQPFVIDGLPQCTSWSGPPRLVTSPTFSQDNTLFAWAGIPAGYDFTHPYFKSTDGGLSWAETLEGPFTRLQDLVLSSNYFNDQTLYLAPGDTLVRSTDGGQTWTSVSLPPSEGTASLALADSNALFLALGGGPPYWYSQQGLFYSGSGGGSWQRIYVGGVRDVALSPNYSQDHTVLIGIAGYHWNGGILKSTDSGHTWQPSREGLEWGSDGVTRDITFSSGYAEDHTVFCLSWEALYKSTDAGAHWVRLAKELVDYPDPLPFGSIWQFVVSPRYATDQTLWLWGDHEGRLISTDGGANWRWMPYPVKPIAAGEYCVAGGSCGVELFGYYWDGSNNYVYKSFDGGMTWHCLEADVTPAPAEIPEPTTLLLTASGLAGLAGYVWQRLHGGRGERLHR